MVPGELFRGGNGAVEVFAYQIERRFDLQDSRGVGDVLGSGSPVAVFACVTPAQMRNLMDEAKHWIADRQRLPRVRFEVIFTMDDIVRFPSESHIYFLECSGNSFWTGNTLQSTVQHTHGEMSCCEWTGVRLSTVLDEAGLDPRATWMLAEGADAAGMARSVPIAKALDDALLVYAQNGERLRPEQGYPLRLFLPGYEGNTNVKWLRRHSATNHFRRGRRHPNIVISCRTAPR